MSLLGDILVNIQLMEGYIQDLLGTDDSIVPSGVSDPIVGQANLGIGEGYANLIADAIQSLTSNIKRVKLHEPPPPAHLDGVLATAGWTSFTSSADSRIIYVSSSGGNDANDGFSTATPKKTLAGGVALLRSGFPDWLLLKKGDVWENGVTETFGSNAIKLGGGGPAGGRSMSEPMLIASYGSGERPKIISHSNTTSCGNVIFFNNNTPLANYVAIVGLWIHSGADGVTPNPNNGNITSGIAVIAAAHTGILIEDCKVEQFVINIQFTNGSAHNTITNCVVRRNVICDASMAGDSLFGHGIYAGNLGSSIFEENIIVHNGWVPGQIPISNATWNESAKTLTQTGAFASYYNTNSVHNGWAAGDVVGITSGSGATVSTYDVASVVSADQIVLKTSIGSGAGGGIVGTLYWVQCFNFNRHNCYFQDGMPNMTFRGNILTEADGIQYRGGGDLINNLGLRLAYAFQFGSGTDLQYDPNGVSGTIRGNVALDGGPDFSNTGSPDGPQHNGHEGGRGSAYILGNTNGVTMSWNLAANNTTGTSPAPIILGFDNGHGPGVGVLATTLDHNVVYGWGGSGGHSGGGETSWWETVPVSAFTFTNNDIQNGIDSSYLVNLPFTMTLSHSLNRYWRSGGSASSLFHDTNGNRSFAQFMSDVSDSGSTNVQATYTDPGNATIGAYYTADGGQHSVTPDGTLWTYVASLRLQSKSSWAPSLMPTYAAKDTAAGALASAYPVGPVALGPLRWLRQKFNATLAAMGLSITSLGTISGSTAGGTTVVITGVGFQNYLPGTSAYYSITFGGTSVQSFTVNSDTQITCVTDAHGAGLVDLVIDNGDGIYTKVGAYTYQ